MVETISVVSLSIESVLMNDVIVDLKSRIGDWEGDTVTRKGCKHGLVTLVEVRPYFL